MKRTHLLLSMLFVLLLVPFAHAEGNHSNTTKPVNTDALNLAAAEAQCKSDFVVAVITSISTNAPAVATTLASYKTKLPADVTQLQTLATNADKNGFKTFMKGTFDPDLKAANKAIKETRWRNSKNVSKNASAAIKSDYAAAKKAFDLCDKKSHKVFGQQKVDAYNDHLDKYQKKADALKAKGVDTTQLDAIITGARTQVMTPLQNAINNATDPKGIRKAIKTYCLYDGCKTANNTNAIDYHMAAKFEIAKMKALLSYYKVKWNLTGDKVAKVQAKIDAADAALAKVGTNKYTSESKEKVWDKINAAAKALKSYKKTGAKK